MNLRKVDNLKYNAINKNFIAGWSSLVARQAHNLKVLGSNPSPATNYVISRLKILDFNSTDIDFIILSKFVLI